MELIRMSSHSDQQDRSGSVTPLVSSGSSGRPSDSVTREQLTFLRSCGFTAAQMADAMNVSVCTVRRQLRSESCSYPVPGPNSLWHINGNYKLIRWRIVIHGAIDAFSRLIVFLQASNNNHSSTVLSAFLGAIACYGLPSRVSTDRREENNSVMNIRGREHGSALGGRSTHQRILGVWRALWRGVTNKYSDFFWFLESEGIIDVDNDLHIWALHYVYLPRINSDLKPFTGMWNHHGLRTEHNKTPLQLFVMGCLQQQGLGLQSTAMQNLFGSARVGQSSATTAVPHEEAPASAGLESAQGTDPPGGNSQLLDWPERVSVPPVDYAVPEELMEQITTQFDPLGGNRDDFGIHIITGLILFLQSAA